MPLYKEDLANVRCPCGVPGCEDPLFFHSKCHLSAPTWTSYFDGILTVRCSVCKRIIGEFFVASRGADRQIAENMRDYWRHKADGAEGINE